MVINCGGFLEYGPPAGDDALTISAGKCCMHADNSGYSLIVLPWTGRIGEEKFQRAIADLEHGY